LILQGKVWDKQGGGRVRLKAESEVEPMAKIKGPGRPRKYTAAGFARACEAYFDSISYQEAVYRRIPAEGEYGNPRFDSKGHQVYRDEQIYTADGKPAYVTNWIEPPGIMALCLYLGIDESTFLRYGEMRPSETMTEAEKHEAEVFCRTVSRARGRVMAYLMEMTQDPKAARGAIWNLQQNFGQKEHREISLDESTRKAISSTGMTMQEKMAMLRSIGDLPEVD
jgi:hypothetical protein